jgi:hypothetical protein
MATTTAFTVAANADDAIASKTGTSYPPTGTTGISTTTPNIEPSRTYDGTNYTIRVGLLRWDTSSLPDNAIISEAKLRLYVNTVQNVDSRDLTADWYTWGPVATGDYSETAQTTALSGTALSGISTGGYREFTLLSPTTVNLTGYTGIRLHISGGSPTGNNYVQTTAHDNGPSQAAQLEVTYTLRQNPIRMMI